MHPAVLISPVSTSPSLRPCSSYLSLSTYCWAVLILILIPGSNNSSLCVICIICIMFSFHFSFFFFSSSFFSYFLVLLVLLCSRTRYADTLLALPMHSRSFLLLAFLGLTVCDHIIRILVCLSCKIRQKESGRALLIGVLMKPGRQDDFM